jgi:hypothetical protein
MSDSHSPLFYKVTDYPQEDKTHAASPPLSSQVVNSDWTTHMAIRQFHNRKSIHQSTSWGDVSRIRIALDVSQKDFMSQDRS